MNSIIKDEAKKPIEIITDVEQLGNRAEEIDPRKQGTLVQEIVLALKTKIRELGITALSAPAIGYPHRIFCISFDHGKDIRTFINPVIGNAEGFELSRETCTSIPDKTFIRPRNGKIMLMYFTPMGKIESRSIAGLTARIIQHEVDHLDGLLLSDIGFEIDEQFDNATDDERAEVINAYLDSLDIRNKAAQAEIQSDTELKKMNDAINFMNAMRTGDVQVEQVAISKEEAEEIKSANEAPAVEENSNNIEDKNIEGGVVEPPKKKRGRKPKDTTLNGN